MGREKLTNRRTVLTEIVWQRRRIILFSMLMSMLIVLAILKRNERHFGRFRNSKFLACDHSIDPALKTLFCMKAFYYLLPGPLRGGTGKRSFPGVGGPGINGPGDRYATHLIQCLLFSKNVPFILLWLIDY